MDIREIPFLLFQEFSVAEKPIEGGFAHLGVTQEGFPLSMKVSRDTSNLMLWNYHADFKWDSPLFTVNAGPRGSWQVSRAQGCCDWSLLASGLPIEGRLDLPYIPTIARLMLRAHELMLSDSFELTNTWSLERGHRNT